MTTKTAKIPRRASLTTGTPQFERAGHRPHCLHRGAGHPLHTSWPETMPNIGETPETILSCSANTLSFLVAPSMSTACLTSMPAFGRLLTAGISEGRGARQIQPHESQLRSGRVGAGAGRSGSGPGGRVVRVIAVGVMMVRVPSGWRWRVQPGAWCFKRWWVRQYVHR